MDVTKVVWGQVLLVSAAILAFVWGATEWVVTRAFQPQQSRPGRRGKNLIAGAGSSVSFAPLVALR